jgi:hypothetical protein
VGAALLNELGECEMKNQAVNGIGCFAKPERLSRIFLKMIQNYTLGPLDKRRLVDGCKLTENENVGLLEALVAGKATRRRSSILDSGSGNENEKITGFFLTLKDQSLELSIFSKSDSRCERHCTKLDAFTRLRRKRLN